MQIHAQSTLMLAEARPPYVHLGYLAATPSHYMGLIGMIFVGIVAYYLILFKLDIAGIILWSIGGIQKLCANRLRGLFAIFFVLSIVVFFIWWV